MPLPAFNKNLIAAARPFLDLFFEKTYQTPGMQITTLATILAMVYMMALKIPINSTHPTHGAANNPGGRRTFNRVFIGPLKELHPSPP